MENDVLHDLVAPKELIQNDSELYFRETWDLSLHSSFSTLSINQQNLVKSRNVLTFPTIGNMEINQELKKYLIFLLDTGKNNLITVRSKFYCLLRISDFIRENYPYSHSIIEISKITLVSEFGEFLEKNGVRKESDFNWVIGADMKVRKYKYPSTYIYFINSFFSYFYNCKNPETEKEEYLKDKWDVRRLPIEVTGINKARPRYTINFSGLSQKQIREIAKKYIYKRLQVGMKMTTCLNDLKGITYLSDFLQDAYPSIQTLAELDRNIIEDFLGYIEQTKIAEETKSKRIGVTSRFFETCQFFNWDGAPNSTLLFAEDIKKNISYYQNLFQLLF